MVWNTYCMNKIFLGVFLIAIVALGGWYISQNRSLFTPQTSSSSTPTDEADPAENAKQDAVLIVSESIVGKWQSREDAQFVREFQDGGILVDYYDNEEVFAGTWSITSGVDAMEIVIEGDGTQEDTLHFTITEFTADTLVLTYMDRGGVLEFSAIK